MEDRPRELKHLSTWRKRKQTSDFLSSGERKGKSLNHSDVSEWGCRTASVQLIHKPKYLERYAIEGDSPVSVPVSSVSSILSRAGPEKSCLNLPAPSGKAKYSLEIDSEPVP